MVKINTRNTKQKQIVASNIKKRFDHPTANEIYEDLIKHNSKIGLTTIYRILNNLVEEGKINKIITPDQHSHFDYNRINHIHFICNKCFHIYDIDENEFSELEFKFMKNNYNIKNISIQGICENCKN